MEVYRQIYEELKQLRRNGELEGTVADRLGLERQRAMDRLLESWRRKDDAVLVRHLAVRALADRVFGDADKANAWLHRPNKAMADQIPFDLLDDELGAAIVVETLEQIDHGIFA